MDDNANVALVRQFYDAFKKGDIACVLSCLSSDIEWNIPEMPGLGFTGKRRGRDAVAEFFRLVPEAQERLAFEPKEFFAQGDRVLALGYQAWKIRASGIRFDGDWVHAFTIREGKIVSFTQWTDTNRTVQAYQATWAAMREPLAR